MATIAKVSNSYSISESWFCVEGFRLNQTQEVKKLIKLSFYDALENI